MHADLPPGATVAADAAAMLKEVVEALVMVGFAAADIETVRRMLAAVLHTGQIKIGSPVEGSDSLVFDAAATAAIKEVC